jgi:hypothetical protein
MLKRYTSSADNTIVNAYQLNMKTRGTGANAGRSDVLETFSIYGRISTSSQELSRILLDFPVTTISADRSAGTIPASGKVSFYLKMFNAPTSKTTPRDYKIVVQPISQSWQEGDGLDLEGYKDITYGGLGSNWISASNTALWTTVGGDYLEDRVYTQDFPDGTENLEINITDMVEDWILGYAGGKYNNYGVSVRLSASYEGSSSAAYVAEDSNVILNPNGAVKSYYTKRFFGRKTQYFFYKPAIEARWDSVTRDERSDFYFSSSRAPANDNMNTIFLYNRIRGRLVNIPEIGTGEICVSLFSGSANNTMPSASAQKVINSANTAVQVLTGGWVETGIYSCSVCLTASSTGSLIKTYYDVWFSGSNTVADATTAKYQYFTGTITPQMQDSGISTNRPRYYLSITNLYSKYFKDDIARMNLFVREKNWKPNIYTVANSSAPTKTIVSGAYRVYRILDGFEAVPYGTGSDYHTGLSYDVSGNYFDLDMSLFEPGYAYGLKFAFYDDRNLSWREQEQVFKFRVEDYEY